MTPQPFKQRLLAISQRVGMFIHPECAEGAALHLSHVWLSSANPEWDLGRTRELWRSVAHDVAHRPRLSGDLEALGRYRAWRWGEREELARKQVVQAYERVSAALRWTPLAEPASGSWAALLLARPELARPPDVLDVSLHALYGLASSSFKDVTSLLQAERKRLWGGAARHLYDVGSAAELAARAPRELPQYTSFPSVSEGIAEAVRRVESLLAS
ncbi:hypothetical protein HPC49_16270 [Pyxidicoccus fallax]|uniref:Uncharacterized protein n=1 Tax=Pyxidicoccus fallax TaxID=394095 RepID=A0A848LFB8_9BACT|nr:hypothetical protein [Pyxidicoccus fallax]NMO17144.1 hypothetical protein [Pyxidicoccus fallax]NPC79775.1 hypothetical protein [Pyxidicoccus fallax]